MSCWVVPIVAAELWGGSLGEVRARIHAGTVVSKMEYGFLLVDTAPLGPLFRSTAAEGAPRPPTFVEVRTWMEVEDEDEVELIEVEAEVEERIEDAGMD